MAEEIKQTKYQKMNTLFTPSATKPSGDNGNRKSKIVIRGDSPADIQRKGLELQQKADLERKYNKNYDYGYMKSMQFEAARLPAYLDYEGMEYYPLVASALDLFMEEATTIGIDGNMLQIYSPNEKIKSALQELFYDIINVNVNLPYWLRNMCKYGDNFVHILGEEGKGITNVKQLVNYEMERIERIVNGKPTIKFKQKMLIDEYNVFEIAHFRILGDDRMAPYGMSLLNKIRRTIKMLIMAEDAVLTNRLIRAADRKLIKIGVGNMDDDDVEEYIMKAAAVFKKQKQIDPETGQFDYRFNLPQNDEDWIIPVRNGDTQTGVSVIEGSQTLDAIQDIEYLRDNLFVGLGIPKPFLGFQDASGGGKNMAQLDVRFAKKVNRIQQAAIQELNKMAMIHLYLLGFDEKDLTKFTLALTNPSTQHDLLKTELLQAKAQVYADLTRSENGIAAMSHTEAMRVLFNYSDKQIIDGLKKMRMEKAIFQELNDSALVIRRTGIFDDIDAKYNKEPIIMPSLQGGQGGETMSGGAPSMGTPNTAEPGGEEFPTPESLPPVQGQADITASYDRGSYEKMIVEYNSRFDGLLETLVTSGDKSTIKPTIIEKSKEVIRENEDRNKVLNSNALDMINEIDSLLTVANNIISEDIELSAEDIATMLEE